MVNENSFCTFNSYSFNRSVYLWQLDLNDCHSFNRLPYTRYFSPSELHQLASIRSERRRKEFIAGHYLLHHLLHCYNEHTTNLGNKFIVKQTTGQAPTLIQANSSNNKPSLFCSLSHTKNNRDTYNNVVTIACCIHQEPIGIDIEIQQPRKSVTDIIDYYFHPDEKQQSLILSKTQRETFFYEHWCIKESCFKLNNYIFNKVAAISPKSIFSINNQSVKAYSATHYITALNCHLAVSSSKSINALEIVLLDKYLTVGQHINIKPTTYFHF